MGEEARAENRGGSEQHARPSRRKGLEPRFLADMLRLVRDRAAAERALGKELHRSESGNVDRRESPRAPVLLLPAQDAFAQMGVRETMTGALVPAAEQRESRPRPEPGKLAFPPVRLDAERDLARGMVLAKQEPFLPALHVPEKDIESITKQRR